MDIQAEKRDLIQWLSGLNDLRSIKEGKVKSHDDVMELTKKEFPNLFE